MSPSRKKTPTSLAFLFCFATTAFAVEGTPAIELPAGRGDPVEGKKKIAICKACHGVDGNSTVTTYPKLAGQHADYLLKQIYDFKSGTRKDPMMSAMIQSAGNEQDLLDIAAYYASQKQMTGGKWFPDGEGKKRFEDTINGCAACHGPDGRGFGADQSLAPVISGQHKDYLVRQLKNFRKGARNNDPDGIMVTVAGSLTDEDIENVAKYVSGL